MGLMPDPTPRPRPRPDGRHRLARRLGTVSRYAVVVLAALNLAGWLDLRPALAAVLGLLAATVLATVYAVWPRESSDAS